MSKLICPVHDKCGVVCAHGIPHEEVVFIGRGGNNTNFCNLICDMLSGNKSCCQPIQTKWDK